MKEDSNVDRKEIAQSRVIVVKVGSAVLTSGKGAIDRRYLGQLAGEIVVAREGGRRVILVSSGAVAGGLAALGLSARPGDVTLLQAAAATGQPLLMSQWRDALAKYGIPVAQLLLTRGDFDSRERFLNIRNCAQALHERGCVAICNENDTVATEEISLGDNDVLAAKLAACVEADALILLTSQDGVLDADDRVVLNVEEAQDLLPLVRQEQTGEGRGGMATKVAAVRIAQHAGIPSVIAAGRPASKLGKVLEGQALGTFVGSGDGPAHKGKRLWIALTATPSGIVEIDEGAVGALQKRQASLLAKGVVGCQGIFNVGDVVSVRAQSGREIGRGLINVSADELRAVSGHESSELASILGRRAHEEVIHRDNLAIIDNRAAK